MDEKKMMLEAKVLKSFLNDFNHIPEMEKPEEPAPEAEEAKEGEEKPEGTCEKCEKEPCECEGEMKADKPMLDAMLKG